ncbi:MAG: hypothetical protein RL596_293 [Bacteroidota bacterium]
MKKTFSALFALFVLIPTLNQILQAQNRRPTGPVSRPPVTRPATRPMTPTYNPRPAPRPSPSPTRPALPPPTNRPSTPTRPPSTNNRLPATTDRSSRDMPNRTPATDRSNRSDRSSRENTNNRDRVNSRDRNKQNITINNNIQINNNRNTMVRRNHVGFYVGRPPFMWGGHRFFCFHPYFYHPFRPFFWSPFWHPWGFFMTSMAATAIIIHVNSIDYQYDRGLWFQPDNNGYVVVQAPVDGTVKTIPENHEKVVVNNITNYYYAGAFYEKTADGYKVIAPQTYYSPVQVDGKNMYEIVQVEDEDEDDKKQKN